MIQGGEPGYFSWTIEQVAQIFEYANIIVVVLDEEGTIKVVNRYAVESSGYDRSELIGSNWFSTLVPKASYPETWDKFTQFKKGKSFLKEPFENPILTRDGQKKYFSWSNTEIHQNDGLRSVVCFGIDISRQKEIETALVKSQRQMAEIINFLPDATLVINLQGEVLTWNNAAEEMTGVKAQDILGKGNYEYALPFYGIRRPLLVDLVLNSGDELDEEYFRVNRREQTLQGESFCPTLGPRGTYISATASPLFDAEGNIIGAIESIRDVTERKRSERYLRVQRDLGMILASSTKLEQVLAVCLDAALEVGEMEAGVICLIDPISGDKYMSFSRGLTDDFMENIQQCQTISRMFSTVLSTAAVYSSYDELRPFVGEALAGYNIKTVAIIPVRFRSQLVAFLMLASFRREGICDFCRKAAEGIAYRIGAIIMAIKSAQALQESEELFRLLAENARDIIYRFQIYPQQRFEYVSPSAMEITGYTPQEHYADPCLGFKLIHPDDRQVLQSMASGAIDYSQPVVIRWLHKDGRVIWTEQRNVPIFDGDKLIAIEGIARDVSERQEMEAQLRYLSFYDSLTGLYNRAYFEQEMKRLESDRFEPLGIIVCDVDGLKMVNDNLGHNAGDILLKGTAKLIKDCFRESDIVARIGGDEFAVLLPNSPQPVVEQGGERLQQAVLYYNANHPSIPISLSQGLAIRSGPSKTISQLFREADNKMYQNKQKNREDFYRQLNQFLSSNSLTAIDF